MSLVNVAKVEQIRVDDAVALVVFSLLFLPFSHRVIITRADA